MTGKAFGTAFPIRSSAARVSVSLAMLFAFEGDVT
jgi:hypothetical protein